MTSSFMMQNFKKWNFYFRLVHIHIFSMNKHVLYSGICLLKMPKYQITYEKMITLSIIWFGCNFVFILKREDVKTSLGIEVEFDWSYWWGDAVGKEEEAILLTRLYFKDQHANRSKLVKKNFINISKGYHVQCIRCKYIGLGLLTLIQALNPI